MYTIKTFKKRVTQAGQVQRLDESGLLTTDVIIKAKKSNAGIIYIGGQNVNADIGFDLEAGAAISLGDILGGRRNEELLNLKEIYLYATNANDEVVCLYAHQLE